MSKHHDGYDDVVVLVPGFFGFGRFGTFSYFVDRVAAALRAALESRRPRERVPVVAVSTAPTSGLAERQTALLDELRALEERTGRIRRLHFVGHSTGSVDAELLTCVRPLDPTATWASADPTEIRQRIRAVVGISSPHYGTRLVDHAVFGLFRDPWRPRSPWAWRDAADLTTRLGVLIATRPLTLEALSASLSPRSGALPFVWRFLRHAEIYADLAPRRMMELRETNPPDRTLGTVVSSVVGVAPASSRPRPDALPACDGLFAELHRMTAHGDQAGDDAKLVREVAATLNAYPRDEIIRHPSTEIPSFDPAANDGIVNSCRQLLRTRTESEPAAVVVADHADVIGYYDRRDSLSSAAPLEEGFFRSGSCFGDDQFFRLYDRIGARISHIIQESL